MIVRLYESINKPEWDTFVGNAKNSHFMFYRDYMDYHSDRFKDHSLMFFDEKHRLMAVMPANLNEKIMYSHQGLSFGGLILSQKLGVAQVIDIFNSMVCFLKSTGYVTSIVYKRIPDFYCSCPSQEDLYALFLLQAKLIRRDVTVAVDQYQPLPYQELRVRKIKRSKKFNLTIKQEGSCYEFWKVLTSVLVSRHRVNPVHTVEEIELLKSRFPENIKCFTASLDGLIVAGVVIYETTGVAHAQYLAVSEEGRECGALDLIIDHLLKVEYKSKKYFDFGISTEDEGRCLNEGLIAQKEGFGARAFVHDFYEIKIN